MELTTSQRAVLHDGIDSEGWPTEVKDSARWIVDHGIDHDEIWNLADYFGLAHLWNL